MYKKILKIESREQESRNSQFYSSLPIYALYQNLMKFVVQLHRRNWKSTNVNTQRTTTDENI